MTQLLDFKPEVENKGVVLLADLPRHGPTLVTGSGRDPPLKRASGRSRYVWKGGGQIGGRVRLTSGTAVSRVERR